MAIRQQFLVEHDFAETPGAKLERLQPEIQTVFEEPVLKLQVLRCQESAFGPENGLQLFHVNRCAGDKDKGSCFNHKLYSR